METVKIFYIIPLTGGLESWGDHSRDLMEAVAGPQTEVYIVDLPDAPVKTIMSTYHSDLVTPLVIQKAIELEEAGASAVGVACLLEPGIAAAKEVLDIPVVGDAEAAMHYASMVGQRFSFLLPGSHAGKFQGSDSSRGIEDLARKYGLSHKLASVRSVQAQSLDFAAAKSNLPDAMLDQAQKAVKEDGADVIISYPTMEVLRHLQTNLDIPVIDPVQAFTVMAESLIKLKISQSKRAYPRPYDIEKIQTLS
jgi:allantoin racemase